MTLDTVPDARDRKLVHVIDEGELTPSDRNFLAMGPYDRKRVRWLQDFGHAWSVAVSHVNRSLTDSS